MLMERVEEADQLIHVCIFWYFPSLRADDMMTHDLFPFAVAWHVGGRRNVYLKQQ